MAEKLASSPSVSGSDSKPHDARGTFPAGTAIIALAVWFFLARLVTRVSAENPTAARLSIFAGVVGAALAAVTVLAMLLDAVRAAQGPMRIIAAIRLVVALPVCLLVAAAMHAMPSNTVQWAGLASASATTAFALVTAVTAARGMGFARGALALLFVGESIEFAWPPTHFALPADTFWPHLLTKLGAWSEVAALLGAALALSWSISATRRTAGSQRTRMFMPLPVIVSVLLSLLASSFPRTVAVAWSEVAFGARFDLVWSPSDGRLLTTTQVLGYLLIPEMVLCAAAISVAANFLDRGAAARRSLGWIAILFAGFGALRLTGPMDPIRLIAVCLGAMLLERAVALEAQDRSAGSSL